MSCQHIVRKATKNKPERRCKIDIFKDHPFCLTHMCTDLNRLCHPYDTCHICVAWKSHDDWRTYEVKLRNKLNAFENPNQRSKTFKRNDIIYAFCKKAYTAIKQKFSDSVCTATSSTKTSIDSQAVAAHQPIVDTASKQVELDSILPPPDSTSSLGENFTGQKRKRPSAPQAAANTHKKGTLPFQPKKKLTGWAAYKSQHPYIPTGLTEITLDPYHYTKLKHDLPSETTTVDFLAKHGIGIMHPAELTDQISDAMDSPNLEDSRNYLKRMKVLSQVGQKKIDRDFGNLYKKNEALKTTLAFIEEQHAKLVNLIFTGKISKVSQNDLAAKKTKIANLQEQLNKAHAQIDNLKAENSCLQQENECLRNIKPL